MGTTASAMSFDDAQFESAAQERITQNLAVLDANSGGTIAVTGGGHKGRSRTTSRLLQTGGLLQHRDPTSVATITPTKFADAKQKEIKIYKRISQDWYAQDWRDKDLNSAEGARALGLQVGDAIGEFYVNSAIAAVVGVLLAYEVVTAGSVGYNGTLDTPDSLDYKKLGQANKLFGDRAAAIRAYAMHGLAFADLFINAQDSNSSSFQVGDIMIVQGGTPLLNRRGLVTDSASLIDTVPIVDTYKTIGLQAGAVQIEESEVLTSSVNQVVGTESTAPENMQWRFDAEMAITMKVSGATYAGADNPTAATLATAAAWTPFAPFDVKRGPGVFALHHV